MNSVPHSPCLSCRQLPTPVSASFEETSMARIWLWWLRLLRNASFKNMDQHVRKLSEPELASIALNPSELRDLQAKQAREF